MIQQAYVSVFLLSVLCSLFGKVCAVQPSGLTQVAQTNNQGPQVPSLKKLMQRKQAGEQQPQPVIQPSNQQAIAATQPSKKVETVPLLEQPAQVPSPNPPSVITSPQQMSQPSGVQPTNQTPPFVQGPDTFGKSQDEIGIQGNWMKKRAWVVRAFELSDHIQKLLISIHETRTTFSTKHSAIDDVLDQLYRSVGVEQGQLDEVYGSIKRYLEKLRAQEQEHLAESPRPYFTSLEDTREGVSKQERQLAQLRLIMDSISELDRSLEDRLKKVDETIATAQHIAAGETELLDKLWYVIDDKKAQAIYFQIKNGVLAKVRAAHDYLTSKLLQDFDAVIAKIQEQIGQTKLVIEQLEAADIIVKDRTQRLQAIKQKAIQEQQKMAEHEAAQRLAKREAKKQHPVAWYIQPVVMLYDGVIEICSWAYRAINFFVRLVVPSQVSGGKVEKESLSDAEDKNQVMHEQPSLPEKESTNIKKE